jgi:hypothetical protein
MEAVWVRKWDSFITEGKQLVATGCRKVKQTTTRDAYLKKLPAKDGGGEESRIKIKRVQVFDCSAQEVETATTRATAPKKEEKRTAAGQPITPEMVELLTSYGLSEGMSQQEQEELIKAETEKLKAELRKNEEKKDRKQGIRIRIGGLREV